MSKSRKTIISFIAGFVFVVCLAFGITGLPQFSRKTVKADAATTTTVTADVQMLEGAAVRIGDDVQTGDQAIRFQAYVKKTCVESGAEVGAYIIPNDLLTGELTNQTEKAKHIPVTDTQYYAYATDTHYVYNFVLYDIPVSSYGRDIAARAYVKTGDTYTWAQNTQVRSLAYVANAALNDSNGDYSDTDNTFLKTYVDGAVSTISVENVTTAINAGEKASLTQTITPVFQADDVSDFIVNYTSANTEVAEIIDGEIIGKKAGIATITATLGTKTATFNVAVNGETQDLQTSETAALSMDLPAGFSVTSVQILGETTDATDVVPETVKTDVTQHGETTATVVVSDGTTNYTLNVPVAIVTKTIKTADDWAALQATAADAVINGYYVLDADITVSAMASVSVNRGKGFCGTLDGRGYTVSNNNAWSASYGLFGGIGTGAVIKNITFSQTGLNAANNRMFLGMFAESAAFVDVTFNLTNQAKSTNTSIISSPLCYGGFTTGCTFTNVEFNIENSTIGSLLSGSNGWLTYNAKTTFNNTAVYVSPTGTTAIDQIGHTGSTVYTAPGLDISGATVMTGITVYNVVEKTVTLETVQDILMTDATHSIDLGAYADYEIESISYNGTDLGTDSDSFTLTESNPANHGAKTIVVSAKSKTEWVTINVPVVLITKEISTIEEFTAIQSPSGDTSSLFGYYVLTDNIGSESTVLKGTRSLAGTIDGRGHSITFTKEEAQGVYGIFTNITDAAFKNVTLNVGRIRSQAYTHLLAEEISNTRFENVTLNMQYVIQRYSGYGIVAQKMTSCTFTNVDFVWMGGEVIYDNYCYLLAQNTFSGNTFSDCTLYLYPGTSYKNIAANSSVDVTAAECDIEVVTVEEQAVSLENRQDILLTDGTHALDLGEYADYTVTAISYGDYDLGTDVSAITIPDEVKTNLQSHGETNITVKAKTTTSLVSITVPVTLITKEIKTIDEFKTAIHAAAGNNSTYGYYILGKDIDTDGAAVVAPKASDNTAGAYGFHGTLDGRNHEIIYTSGANGLFGSLGSGAVVKNVTLTDTACQPRYEGGEVVSLARLFAGATISDVTVNLKNCIKTTTESYGALSYQGFLSSTLTNVTINVEGEVFSLFGAAKSDYWGLKNTTFNNCQINVALDSSLSEIGHLNTTVYTAEGMDSVYAFDGTEVANATTISGINVTKLIRKEVALSNAQELLVSEEIVALELGDYDGYEVSSITYGDYDLGTDVSNIVLSDELKNDATKHGEQEIIINAGKGTEYVKITVPVILITKAIKSADDWTALQVTADGTAVYGYYVLANDVVAPTNTVKVSANTSGTNGFRGTLDGKGYKVSNTNAWGTNGIFGAIGAGAVIKNVAFEQTGLSAAYNRYFLGQIAVNAVFTDVTFDLINQVVAADNTLSGPLTYDGFVNCTLTNVEFNLINSTVKTLLGGGQNAYLGLKNTTFTNCRVNLLPVGTTTLTEIGHCGNPNDGATVYTAEGLTVEGATVLSGITVQTVTAREVSVMTVQDVDVSSSSNALELGLYNDYAVTSIAYGDYDLGTNLSALAISDELKADTTSHGADKTVSVTAYKGGDVVELSVPVAIVTKKIKTADDWAALQATAADAVINGYYVLDADITVSAMASVSVNRGKGFCGTLDGRGYTVSNNNAWSASYGLFGGIGTGAVIKNITFSQTGLNAANNRMFLGMFAESAAFVDVTFNLTNQAKSTNTSIISSPLCYGGFTTGCTFTNVEFNIENSTIGSLLSGGNGWLTYNAKTTFTNTAVYITDDTTTIDQIGHTGSTVYTAPGLDISGATVMTGITVYSGDSILLLQSGVSPYSIVKSADATVRENEAASELQYFFKLATGYELPIITDSGLTHDTVKAYISLGDTTLYQSANITASGLKEDGSWIKTVDNTIYIVGGGNNDGDGVLYGVYEFLQELFGLEIYSTDCYEYTTKTQIPLAAYDIISNPDIDMRSQTGLLLGDSDYANRIRSTDYYWAELLPIVHAEDSSKADAGHNSLYYLPYTKYGTSNPNFYSNTSTFESNSWGGINAQLCYTGRGDQTTYDLMVQLCAERIQASLIQYKDTASYSAVMLGMEDNYYMCECSACQAVITQYGSISATVIIFLNDVAELVDAWMIGDGAEYARDLQYMFYAYQQNLAVPTTMPTITTKLAPLVAFSEMDHSATPTDTTVRETNVGNLSNNQILGYLKSWGEWATANGTSAWAWSYGNFYRDYFCFYDSYDFYAEIFGYLKEYGYTFSYVQQQSDQRGAQSAFMTLNNYVTSKLAWDSTLNMDTLISNYMNAMYADAAEEMIAIFENWQSLYASELKDLGLGTENPGKNLSKSQVDNMFALFDKAYAAIEGYKTTDEELYAKLKARIDMEWLAPAKIALVDLNSSYKYFNWSGTYKYDDIKAQFNEIVTALGITAANEFESISAITNAI